MVIFGQWTYYKAGILLTASLFLGCTAPVELEWHREKGYRWAELSPGYFGSSGFTALGRSDTGIQFEHYISPDSIDENRHYLNGSGVAAADVDGDGWVDLYFAQLEGPNKLYRNRGGWEFTDITKTANLAHKGYNSTGVVFADANGDTYPDLFITSLSRENELYLNDGKGHFTLKEESGLTRSKGSNTIALADIDGDGDLDLYITNYKIKTVRDIYSAEELSTGNTVRKQGDSLVVIPPFDKYYGIIETEGQSYRNEYGARDELFINRGDGTFQKVTDDKDYFLDADGNRQGLSRDWGLTAKFQDINGDGSPDLYVANDFWTPDRLWINRGDGTFKAIRKNAIRNMSFSSMGVDFSDINRDGFLDIFVSEMLSGDHRRRSRQLSQQLDPIEGRPQYNRNSLYLNRGDHTFAEISNYSKVAATEWSWATNFMDIDLDGYEDLIIATGYGYDYQDIDTQIEMNRRAASGISDGDILSYPRLALPNKMLHNNKDLTFSDKSEQWGFTEKDISLGMAFADLDRDGDADFAVNRFNREAAVYRNDTNAPRIAVQLRGEPPNTAGIGARVLLKGGPVDQQKEMSAGGTYVSGSQQMLTFAADPDNLNHRLVVHWPDGTTSSIDSVQADRIYDIEQSSAAPDAGPANKKANPVHNKAVPVTPNNKEESDGPLFRDLSNRAGYLHHEDPYTDFNVQPLLPVLLSRQGPGVSWIDFDMDGDDDLFITSGKGGRMGVFENRGGGRFKQVSIGNLSDAAAGDQTTILGWRADDAVTLVTGSANFEQGNPGVPSAYAYVIDDDDDDSGDINDDSGVVQNIPGRLSTTGPLAASDYDGDGDLDLFLGGRFKPGQYPRDASSRLFKNDNGRFVLDRVNSNKLDGAGLVSGAVFTDYDRDGDQDLVLSRAWDSLVLLENRKGNFADVSSEFGLDAFKGWWHGIATGDFNGDGRPDIIATNIGKNSVYQPAGEYPLRLYYSDFDMDGTLDVIDSYYSSTVQAYVPRRKLYEFDSMPSIAGRVTSHRAYAQSSVSEIIGQEISAVPSRELNTVEHMLFLNTEEGFSAQPLPQKAQFSSAFHAGVADFDNDGKEDLFLSQNSFLFPDLIPRLDAGRGLILLGDGKGGFKIVEGQHSGITVYGPQRGASVSDFNNDGRADLAVSQNAADIKLYLNQVKEKGVRVGLAGPSANQNGIGSAMRLLYKDGSRGPLREVQAGAGYWSQHSTTQVLGAAREADALEIHWFNGRIDTVTLSPGRDEYIIHY